MQPARAGNLLEMLQQIPDPRGRQGRRFSLSAMLATVICGILCGARGYEAIAGWLAVQEPKVAYAITSVPRVQAGAAKLLGWWRGHWGIENRLHWGRDVPLGEDACRIRTGNAPYVRSLLRNAPINLLRSLGHRQITQTLRENACRVDLLLARLGILKQ